jgi:hypothetical protein
MARGFTRALQRAAARSAGIIVPKAGLTVEESGMGSQHHTILRLSDVLITVPDADAFIGQKLYTFPQGRLEVQGGVASLAFGVTTARAGTINDNAAMDWSLGTVTASNVTLGSTMVDVIAKQDKTLDGAVAAYTTPSNANVAAAAAYDGTSAAKELFLNISFPTTTDIDADGTLKVSGYIDLTWALWGDY